MFSMTISYLFFFTGPSYQIPFYLVLISMLQLDIFTEKLPTLV